MTLSSIERANAVLREEVHHEWRDWTRYLEAHLTLLDARAAERRIAFERDEALEERVARARGALAALPQERRALFDQLRDERRQAVQVSLEAKSTDGRPLDPDAVEREALELLRAEALGANDPEGWGVVPLREGSSVTWFEVHVPSLGGAPTAATYALGNQEEGNLRMRFILAGLLVVAGLLFFLVWFLWPRGESGSASAPRAAATANGVALSPWPITAAVVERTNHEPVTLTIQTEEFQSDEPGARWHPEQLVPLRLCLPAAVLADATRITLVSGEGRPDRAYTLVASSTDTPDLILEPCGGSAAPRAAVLQQLITASDATVGEEQTLAEGAAVTLIDLTVVGPGDDPTLPPAQARVMARVRGEIRDWAAAAPTLLLPDGQALLPAAAPITDTGQTTLSYLIPLPVAELPVAWSLAPPGGGPPVRWRATLPVPPTREAVLRSALLVSGVRPELRDQLLVLTIQLRNDHDRPVQLMPDDLRLTRAMSNEALALAFPAPEALTAALAPGAARTLIVTAPLRGSLTGPLILSVGAARFRIAPGG